MTEKKILIVDSDPGANDQIALVCRDFHYKVGLIEEGEGLTESLLADPPDLIILSVELADKNGFVLFKEIRSQKKIKKIPIILVSENPDDSAFKKHQKLKERADGYFLKPVVADDLIDCIEECIGLPDAPKKTPKPKLEEKLKHLQNREAALQKELHEKDRELKMLRESYENVSQKLERSNQEIKNLQEGYQTDEQRFFNLNQDYEKEKIKFEEEKRELAEQFDKERQDLTLKNEDLQGQLQQILAEGEELKRQWEQLERRSELAEKENYEREKNLKKRINDLLADVDEQKQIQEDLRKQLAEIQNKHDEDKNSLEEKSKSLEDEKLKMEQRVIKAYKKIKMDQLRDEKMKKALEIALTLLEGEEKT